MYRCPSRSGFSLVLQLCSSLEMFYHNSVHFVHVHMWAFCYWIGAEAIYSVNALFRKFTECLYVKCFHYNTFFNQRTIENVRCFTVWGAYVCGHLVVWCTCFMCCNTPIAGVQGMADKGRTANWEKSGHWSADLRCVTGVSTGVGQEVPVHTRHVTSCGCSLSWERLSDDEDAFGCTKLCTKPVGRTMTRQDMLYVMSCHVMSCHDMSWQNMTWHERTCYVMSCMYIQMGLCGHC